MQWKKASEPPPDKKGYYHCKSYGEETLFTAAEIKSANDEHKENIYWLDESPAPSKDVEAAAKEYAMNETCKGNEPQTDWERSNIKYLSHHFIAGAKWAGKEATPVDGGLPGAIDTLVAELKKDQSEGSYYYAWQANIAMAIKDEFDREGSIDKSNIPFSKVHEIANQAAKNFLNVLMLPNEQKVQECDATGDAHSDAAGQTELKQKYASYLGEKNELDTSDSDAVEWAGKNLKQ